MLMFALYIDTCYSINCSSRHQYGSCSVKALQRKLIADISMELFCFWKRTKMICIMVGCVGLNWSNKPTQHGFRSMNTKTKAVTWAVANTERAMKRSAAACRLSNLLCMLKVENPDLVKLPDKVSVFTAITTFPTGYPGWHLHLHYHRSTFFL